MQGPGRADIVNAGSGKSRYSECRVRGDWDIVNAGSRETKDIVNAGSGETRYSECRGPWRADIVNAGSGETRYSECRVRGDQI
ncbi:unnamed protein product [Staurois parvus]|uniref:Pectinesterase n=1 Tax=Staurois parvus TaxID=386267 RepID=A0ABN9FK23_9NEOB|nr:unnamed protein product [Staurois parvus]